MNSELPDGWRWAKLGEICAINPRRPKDLGLSPADEVTFVPMAAVDESAAAIASPQVRQFREVAKGYTYMQDGDVIFAKITPCMQNGKHAIVADTHTGIAFGSTEFHVLRPTDQVISTWVHRFLLRPELLAEAQSRFTGTAGQQRVPKEFLIEKVIPLPPLDEQHRIAETMALVERARSSAAAQLAMINELFTAMLREIFPAIAIRAIIARMAMGHARGSVRSRKWVNAQVIPPRVLGWRYLLDHAR